MLSKRAYLSSLGLIILVGISSWLSIRGGGDEIHPPEEVYVSNKAKHIVITQMNPNGQLKYTAHAESAEQYSNGPTKLFFPLLELYDTKNTTQYPWTLHSNEALINESHQKIFLTGQVVIAREKTDNTPALRLLTEHITVYPEHNYAETEDPVTIEIPKTGTHISAVGMKIYLNPERLELLTQIRSTYEKTQ